MVTVEFNRTGNRFALKMKGHAGAAPEGQDVVCAAVSILMFTAAQASLDLYTEKCLTRWPSFELEKGRSYVEAVARKDRAEAVERTFRTVMTGMELLQTQYPQFVMVKK